LADFPTVARVVVLTGALATVLAGFLAGAVLASVLAVFFAALAAGFLADAFVPRLEAFAGADFPADALRVIRGEDFLRVFLDIRLPFVAFRGSTIRVLRVSSLLAGFGAAAGQV
jgi:hypothetical protein